MDLSSNARPSSGIPRIHLQLSLRQSMLFQAKNLGQFFAITTRPSQQFSAKNNGRWTASGSSVEASKSMSFESTRQSRLRPSQEEPLNRFYSHLQKVEVDLEEFYKTVPSTLKLRLFA